MSCDPLIWRYNYNYTVKQVIVCQTNVEFKQFITLKN